MRKVLAVSSGGGHWIELLRVAPAFTACDLHYVTVNESYQSDIGSQNFSLIRDATRWNPLILMVIALQLLFIFLKFRPDIVVSTGAAPGLVSLYLAKLFRCKTIWIDSIANVDELSGSGRYAKNVADLWLTQWEHLAEPAGPIFAGSVL